jgi:hypothetical protein
MGGDAALFAVLVVVPLAAGGLVALLSAWLLWRGSSGGVALAVLWVALAGLASAITFAADRTALSAIKLVLVESARWSVAWPDLELHTVSGGSSYLRLDDVTFLIPGIVAAAAMMVACFLLAGHFATQRRDRHAGPR